MSMNNSGYTQISRIIIFSFIGVFLVFSIFTYFLINKNISDETKAAMKQAKTIQQSQVSIDNIENILKDSPHLTVERFYGRLSQDPFNLTENNESSAINDKIEPIIMPLSENSYLIIRPNNDTEFSQNILFFYLVAALFVVTLGLLLIIIRLGIAHQLKPLKELASALQNTLKGDQVDSSRSVVLPHSDMQEIQCVFDEYISLKQQLIDNELALTEADRKLAMLQEQERSYLARELHDNVGQLITSTKAYAHILMHTDNSQIIIDSSSKVKNYCSQIGTAIRELTSHLHPIILDKVTLWEAVERLIAEQQAISPQIQWQLNIHCENFIANKERDIHLYRIVQESINNIVKHSNATKAEVNAVINHDMLQLDIKDNGLGLNEIQHSQGLGLSTIKTRARCIGAHLSLGSVQGVGTKITIQVEVHNEDEFL